MTKGSIITLSHAELDRVSVIQAIISRQLTQAQAAHGAAGIASKRRGRCPGNALSAADRQQALALIRAHYIDFGLTFAQEKLTSSLPSMGVRLPFIAINTVSFGSIAPIRKAN